MGVEQTRVLCPQCGTLTPTDRLGGICRDCLGSLAKDEKSLHVNNFRSPRLLPPLPAEAAQANVGARLGKFIPTAKLGSGSSGEVWKAWDTLLNRWVALKIFPVEDTEETARFAREAVTTAKLSHPHIAALYEAGEDKGRHFLAMQFVDGVTLKKYAQSDLRILVGIIRDVARAVGAAHDQGIVHRDLKPANIAVARRNEDPSRPHVFVLDFGLARRIEGSDKLTTSGMVVGTPAYMPPEQARGELVDGRADVYALGATLYELLAKRPPFRGPNVYEVLRKVQESDPESPRVYDSKIPRDLELVVLKALEKNSNHRYASITEMAEDLDRFLEGDPVLARRPSFLYRVRVKLAKRKSVVTTAIASLALAATLGWWFLIGSQDARHYRWMAAGNKLWGEAQLSASTGGDPGEFQKKVRAAKQAFELAIQARDDSAAQLMRAKCLEVGGQDDEALKALERACELNIGNPEARVELAKALFLRYRSSRGLPGIVRFSGRNDYLGLLRFGDPSRETDEQRHWRERGEKLLAAGEVTRSQENLLNGLLAMARDEYARAAETLAVYTRSERWDGTAGNLEGVCHYFAGNPNGAVAALDRTLRLAPNANGFFWRAAAKSALGLRDEAIEDLTTAIEEDPQFAIAYDERGAQKAAKGRYVEAIADHVKAIEIDPTFAAAQVNLGNVKRELGLLDDALAAYTRAIQLNSKSPLGYYGRGHLKSRQGRHNEAIEDYTKAILADSKFAAAYHNRGWSKAAERRYSDAIKDFTEAIELDLKIPEVYHNRGQAKAALGFYEDAIADYTAAINADAKYADAYVSRGFVKCVVKQLYAAGIDDFIEAIRLDPNQWRAYANCGFAKTHLGRFEDALIDYRKALDVAPPDCPQLTELSENVACLESELHCNLLPKTAQDSFDRSFQLHGEGEYGKAIEGFRKIAGEFPKTQVGIKSAYNAACGYSLLGMKGEGLDWLEKAVRMGWKDVRHMKSDADLESLRGEQRFKRVVEKLELK